MRKTSNYGLSLYDKEDKMIITAAENSLNANMEILDEALKDLHNHENKNVLDSITEEDIKKWNSGGAEILDESITYKKIKGLVYVESDSGNTGGDNGGNSGGVLGKNIFDKSTMVRNGYVNNINAGGAYVAQNNGRIAIVPIEEGKTYAFWAKDKPWQYTVMGSVTFWDSEETEIMQFLLQDTETLTSFQERSGKNATIYRDATRKGFTFTAPKNAAFLCITMCWNGGTDYTDVFMVELGDTCSDYEEYRVSTVNVVSETTEVDGIEGYEITKMFDASLRDTVARQSIEELRELIETGSGDSTNEEKKWTVLGDSISINTSHTNKFYHDMLSETNGLTVTNLAESGTSWTRILDKFAPNIPTDTDIITIMMGTNDVTRELGALNEKTGMYGTVYSVLTYLLQNFPNASIGVITPVPRGDSEENYTALQNLGKAISEICELLSVPCFELHKCSGMYPLIAERVSKMYNDAGIHPNLNGQKRMATTIEPWFKTIIKD